MQHRRCGDAADAKARTQTPTEALEAQELTVAATAAAAARRKKKIMMMLTTNSETERKGRGRCS